MERTIAICVKCGAMTEGQPGDEVIICSRCGREMHPKDKKSEKKPVKKKPVKK